MTKADYDQYVETVRESMVAHNITHVSTALTKCPTCDVEFSCGTCPECGADAGSFPNEPYISSRDCDLCGDGLQGDRMDAVGFSMDDKEAPNVELCICPDCEYFQEYGRLPDAVMDEIGE